MVSSMTAYAHREREVFATRIAWEVRSVNHRYLDLRPRLPDAMRFLEPDIRESLGKSLARGKVDCTLHLETVGVASARVLVNHEYVDQLVNACAALAERHGRGAAPAPLELLRFPGVLAEPRPDVEPLAAPVLALLEETLTALNEARHREGARLAALIQGRVEELEQRLGRVQARRGAVDAAARERLQSRVAELAASVDQQRMEQELAILAQRLDVSEELERGLAHTSEVSRVLHSGGAIGRRLDFLMQELNREANTLTSKAADTATTQEAVEMKVLIEQMREQIQNLE